MLPRALSTLKLPSLRPAILARASSSSSAASGPPQPPRGMDPLDRQTADRLASGAQASPSGSGEAAAAAGTRVAVAQMTSSNSTEGNFKTVSRLAQVGAECLEVRHAQSGAASMRWPLLHAPLLQDAVARGCKMLFLPENVSFLGTSFTEVHMSMSAAVFSSSNPAIRFG